MKNKSGIGSGLATAIGSGIGGGLRKPTQIKQAVANTTSNFPASNGINGHGIVGGKIQNKFGNDINAVNSAS